MNYSVSESEAYEAVTDLDVLSSISTVTRITEGSNESFRVETADDTFVAKFNTFSQNRTFRAEIRILRVLYNEDIIPVPEIVAAKERRRGYASPFFLMDYIEGETPRLTDSYDSTLIQQIGFAILCLSSFDTPTVRGYGRIKPSGEPGCLEADSDSWREYYLDYIHGVLHDAERTAPDFLQEYISPLHNAITTRAESIPVTPNTGVILPDFRLDNLLINTNTREVTAILDFERADLGDPHLTLANTQYLLGRDLTESAKRTLRNDLSGGFSGWMPEQKEQTYRLGALAKEVRAFDHWWANVTDTEYTNHRNRLCTELESVL